MDAWLRLALAPRPGVNPEQQPGLEPARWPELLDWPVGQLQSAGFRKPFIDALKSPDPGLRESASAWLESPAHHLITRADPCYPPLLARIDDAPLALFVHGSPECLVRPQIAIVGSRNATAGGREIAAEFAHALSRAGLVIVSGLAEGIDAAAHRATLEAGGETIAVFGTGPDQVYPARNRDLARRIVEQGAVVSSYAPGTGPRRANFPARNRIISGMSAGVVVVEAGMRSGSLITARLAGEQGREVFAVPGSIRNPLARGCHRLIRQGAKLVEEPSEVIEDLRSLLLELAEDLRARLNQPPDSGPVRAGHATTAAGLDDRQTRLLDVMDFDPAPVERLIERSGLATHEVSSALLELELAGAVEAHGGGRYSRVRA